MRIAMLPSATRVLLVAFVASLLLLAWTLVGPRGLPTVANATVPTFPAYPADSAVQATHAPNGADRAWAQPLFFRDRKPHVAALGGSGDANGAVASGFDATLTGIVRSATLNAASLQKPGQQHSVWVRLGQEVPDAPGWRLVDLTAKTARFQSGSDEKILKLEVSRSDGPQAASPAMANATPPQGTAPDPGASQVRKNEKEPAQASPPPAKAPTPGSAAPNPQGALSSQQQVEMVRQRIEAARKAQQQPPSSSAKH